MQNASVSASLLLQNSAVHEWIQVEINVRYISYFTNITSFIFMVFQFQLLVAAPASVTHSAQHIALTHLKSLFLPIESISLVAI